MKTPQTWYLNQNLHQRVTSYRFLYFFATALKWTYFYHGDLLFVINKGCSSHPNRGVINTMMN